MYSNDSDKQNIEKKTKKTKTESPTNTHEKSHENTNENNSQNSDIQMIMTQCNITMQKAVELYAKHNHDVVSVIAEHINPSYKQTSKCYIQKNKKTELQKKFDAMRKISAKKDLMFKDYLNAQKQSSKQQQSSNETTQQQPSTPQHVANDSSSSEPIIEDITHLEEEN